MSQTKLLSKLPNLETSIFTEMSMLAAETGAINLSQGFPEFETPDFLKNSVNQAKLTLNERPATPENRSRSGGAHSHLSAMLPLNPLLMYRHGPPSVHDRRKVLHFVIHRGDEAILALLRVALGRRVVRRGQVCVQNFLQ